MIGVAQVDSQDRVGASLAVLVVAIAGGVAGWALWAMLDRLESRLPGRPYWIIIAMAISTIAARLTPQGTVGIVLASVIGGIVIGMTLRANSMAA